MNKVKKKALFLDDNEERRKKAYECLADSYELHIAKTATEAIHLLREHSPYEVVYLDHDLGGEVLSESDEDSGFAVAEYIYALDINNLPKRVVIHSWNPAGARRIHQLLQGIVPVSIQMFQPADFQVKKKN